MVNALDLTNLRDITGGDADLEKMLLRTFLDSSNESLRALRLACTGGNADDWRKTAHALKGIALNIGAFPLSEICKSAESAPQATLEQKQRLLTAIESELATIRAEITLAIS